MLCSSLLLLSVGCGGDNRDMRDFAQTVSLNGEPLLKIECTYVGKQPGEPGKFKSRHDYRKINTDFYRITMENLTDKEIRIERVDYRLSIGQLSGAQFASADSIQSTWGTNIIEPRSKLSRSNNMVYARGKRNTLFKNYSFKMAGVEQTLQAEVPLVYIR